MRLQTGPNVEAIDDVEAHIEANGTELDDLIVASVEPGRLEVIDNEAHRGDHSIDIACLHPIPRHRKAS
jgi:hypothetical protein